MDLTLFVRSSTIASYPFERSRGVRFLYTILSLRALLARALWSLSYVACINYDFQVNRRPSYDRVSKTVVLCPLSPWPLDPRSPKLSLLPFLVSKFE